MGSYVYVADGDSGLAVLEVQVQYPPTDLQLSNATIAENLPAGSLVGQFSSVDPNPQDSFTYTLVTGTGDSDNASFSIVGDELRTAAAFDFEAKSSYSIRVRTTDQAGLWFEKSFTISVSDVDDRAPVVITGTAGSDQISCGGGREPLCHQPQWRGQLLLDRACRQPQHRRPGRR